MSINWVKRAIYIIDGDDDMVLSNGMWHENDGGLGSFQPHLIDGDPYRASSVFCADIDQDGRMDVVAGSVNVGQGIVWRKDYIQYRVIMTTRSVNQVPMLSFLPRPARRGGLWIFQPSLRKNSSVGILTACRSVPLQYLRSRIENDEPG